MIRAYSKERRGPCKKTDHGIKRKIKRSDQKTFGGAKDCDKESKEITTCRAGDKIASLNVQVRTQWSVDGKITMAMSH